MKTVASPASKWPVILLFFVVLSALNVRAQQYDFQTAPYDSAYINLVEGNGFSMDSVLEILTYSRPGEEDVDLI